MNPKSPKKLLFFISIGLTLLIIISFEPLRHNDFISYDDVDYVTENPHIRLGFTWESVHWAFTSGFAANWHPLTWLSHMVDIEFFGLEPTGHHLHSLFLHTFSSILLFWILYQMTAGIWTSAFAAVVFAIHPLRVESVAWASERKDVLCVLFWMLTLLTYLNYVKKNGTLRYWLMIVCFALGLMAKPMIVTLPLVMLFLDFWPLNRFHKNIPRLIAEKIPLFILAFLSCIVTILVQQHGKSISTQEEFPFVFRMLHAVVSYAEYLYKMIWPKDLAVLYPFPEAGVRVVYIVLGVIVTLLVTTYVYMQRKSKPYLVTGWLWYIITLLPVIGLIHVGSQRIADRYTYLPSVGLTIMLAWLAADNFSGKYFYRVIMAGLCSIIIIAMVWSTQNQLSYWQNSVTLYEHTLAITSDNCIIENNLASELLARKRYQQAYEHIVKSLAVWPENPWANANMAAVLIHRNRPDEALGYIRKTLDAEPHNSDAWWQQGKIFEMLQKNDLAIQAYEQCLQHDPFDAEAWNNLGVLRGKQGLDDQAADCFRRAVKIKPDYTDANHNLAVYLQSKGDTLQAAQYYHSILKTRPEDTAASYALAVILAQSGQYHESIHYYNLTLKNNPHHESALNDLAWILSAGPDDSIRDTSRAVQLAQQANQKTGFKNPSCLDTLAVAYAAQGQYKEAIETAQKAIDTAKAVGQTELAMRVEKRLELYRNSKPYRDLLPKQ